MYGFLLCFEYVQYSRNVPDFGLSFLERFTKLLSSYRIIARESPVIRVIPSSFENICWESPVIRVIPTFSLNINYTYLIYKAKVYWCVLYDFVGW